LTIEYQDEHLTRQSDESGLEGIVNLRTTLIPVGIAIFATSSTSVHLKTTNVAQNGFRQSSPFVEPIPITDRFWITDISIEYRLPMRRGALSFGLANAFNRHLNFVDSDVNSPRFAEDRAGYVKLTLSF
jgi:hypothetical protein